MSQQQIIWTALPNGIRQDGSSQWLKISVYVALRLQPDGEQQQLPSLFVNWPKVLGPDGVAFDVVVDLDADHTNVFRVRAAVVTPLLPDSILWGAVFNTATPVRSRAASGLASKPVSSYSPSALAKILQGSYQQLSTPNPQQPNKLYGAADSSSLKAAFSVVHGGMRKARTERTASMIQALKNAASIDESHFPELREYLATSLLALDPDMSRQQKVSAAKVIAARLAQTAGAMVPVVPRTDDPVSLFAQFLAFHHRDDPTASDTPHFSQPDSADQEPNDFHRTLTALAEYPELLRRLGLVIDLEVPADGFPLSGFGQPKRLWVDPTFTPPLPSDAVPCFPATKYLLDLGSSSDVSPLPLFCAAPNVASDTRPSAAEILYGLLNLQVEAQDPPFDITQTDIDGAVSKIINTISGIQIDDDQAAHPIDHSDDAGAPSLRTSGLSIAWAGHADVLYECLQRADAHETALANGTPPELFAEDLIRGYRIDVLASPPGNAGSQPSAWLSLHQRIGTYVFPNNGGTPITLPNVADEGFVQPGLVQNIPAGSTTPDPTIYAHESLFHWQSWSLSVPRPSNPVDTSPGSPPPPPPPASSPAVTSSFVVPGGALPRLRFGWSYYLRARTVDLAGNGLTVDEADQVVAALSAKNFPSPILPAASSGLCYCRYEPIHAPELVLRQELTEGESFEVLVIRSNKGISAANFAVSLGDPGYRGVNERHVAPPKTSQLMAELHGLLDNSFGLSGDFEKYYNICVKEKGTFKDPAVVNVATGLAERLPDFVAFDPRTRVRTVIESGLRFVSAPAGASGGYTIHIEAQLKLPYLPDPLARGAALFGLPGVPEGWRGSIDANGKFAIGPAALIAPSAQSSLGRVTNIDFGSRELWPDMLPFRLQLSEPPDDPNFDGLPSWDNAARVLTVFLKKAETATVWLSSYPGRDDLDPNSGGCLGLYAWAYPMLANRVMTPRQVAETAAAGALALLCPSKKIILVHAVLQPLEAPISNKDFSAYKYPNDTRAYIGGSWYIDGKSTAKLDLFAAWKEPGEDDPQPRQFTTHVYEVPIHLGAAPQGGDDLVHPIAIYTPGSGGAQDVQDVVQFIAPASQPGANETYLSRHEFGDTRYRKVTYTLVATSRFRDYFPPDITGNTDNITRVSDPITAVVWSSAKPVAPTVLYILPSFQWALPDPISDTPFTRGRAGGGVRIYLGPRWYSSGDGEQLAVVIHGSGGATTEWRTDPISQRGRYTSPEVGLKDVSGKTLSPINVNGLDIFPYDVEFDADRKLFYADIVFDVRGTHFPFVKLELARYQGNSYPGMWLSATVSAGIVQLAPDRFVTLLSKTDPATPDQRTIAIQVSEQTQQAQPRGLGGIIAKIEVSLEQRIILGTADELGWDLADAPLQPVETGGTMTVPPDLSPLWTGQVTLPVPPTAGEFRLVVKELEMFPANGSPQPQNRLVFADTIGIWN